MKLAVRGLVKEYRGFASFRERLAAALSLGLYSGSLRFRALDGVDFEAGEAGGVDSADDDNQADGDSDLAGEVRRRGEGEILGVIGPNGAGKSTLLRLLSGVSRPQAGSIQSDAGSVRSILELGVGFNGDLTGRENIYYNGRLWGYSGRRLLEAMDEILDFARLRDYADRPLSTYSTGMQMRLGFALASFERSDLLLIDEALAVGDASFQQKCVRRFQEFRDAGSLIIVVSHDLYMLQSVCDRILLLQRGRVRSLGRPKDVIHEYMQAIAEESFDGEGQAPALSAREYELRLEDADGRPRRSFVAGESARLVLRLKPERDLPDLTAGVHFSDRRGLRIFGVNSAQLGRRFGLQAGRSKELVFALQLNLGPGRYNAGFSLHRGASHAEDCYVWEESLIDFEVEVGGEAFEGVAWLAPELRIDSASKND